MLQEFSCPARVALVLLFFSNFTGNGVAKAAFASALPDLRLRLCGVLILCISFTVWLFVDSARAAAGLFFARLTSRFKAFPDSTFGRPAHLLFEIP